MKFLPKLNSKIELGNLSFLPPNATKVERLLPSHMQVHCVEKLREFIYAGSQYYYLTVLIKQFIINGYSNRNPLAPEYIIKTRNNNLLESKLIANANPLIAVLIGISGTGKSVAVERILTTYCTQVIEHAKFEKSYLLMDQLVWLKIDFPCQPTMRSFCLCILDKIDQILGTDYFSLFSYQKQKEEERIEQVAKILWLHGVGLFIVDEFQGITKANGMEKRLILDFLEKINIVVGIPTLLIGTPSALSVLPDVFLSTIVRWSKFSFNEEWNSLVHELLKYQWTLHEVENFSDISRELFEVSLGITDIAIKLYIAAQQYCINRDIARVTPEIITLVNREKYKLVQPMLHVLREEDTKNLLQYSAIVSK
ncbi:ATP-binding protein [Sporomusa acidovorans]|uniref:ATP-binding protein n=1 Tax=Sporomusa acidovorans TaxID=112900 RepID=UPI0008882ECB|nr:ATP-binding protein [Sporomusa acidovorans]OZC19000.1 transposon Tn7 transposition protein TnsC [Sporomusa acidovorans DSM 3132]SDD72647.1 AAA domain-containing protein [Sporomusa acidovorans]